MSGFDVCRNRACVNPEHLEAVTHRENIRRSPGAPPAVNQRKTHCDAGHSLDDAYRWRGQRKCRTCHRDAARRYRERRAA